MAILDRIGDIYKGANEAETRGVARRKEARDAFKQAVELMGPEASKADVFAAYTAALPSFDPYTRAAIPNEVLGAIAAGKAREKELQQVNDATTKMKAATETRKAITDYVVDGLIGGKDEKTLTSEVEANFGHLESSPAVKPIFDAYRADPSGFVKSMNAKAIAKATADFDKTPLHMLLADPNIDKNPILRGALDNRIASETKRIVELTTGLSVANEAGTDIDQNKLVALLRTYNFPVDNPRIAAGVVEGMRMQLRAKLPGEINARKMETTRLDTAQSNAVTAGAAADAAIVPKLTEMTADEAAAEYARVYQTTLEEGRRRALNALRSQHAKLLAANDATNTPAAQATAAQAAWSKTLKDNGEAIKAHRANARATFGSDAWFKNSPKKQAAMDALTGMYWYQSADGGNSALVLGELVKASEGKTSQDIIADVRKQAAARGLVTEAEMAANVKATAIAKIGGQRRDITAIEIKIDKNARDTHARGLDAAYQSISGAFVKLEQAIANGDNEAIKDVKKSYDAISATLPKVMADDRMYVGDAELRQRNRLLAETMRQFMERADANKAKLKLKSETDKAAETSTAKTDKDRKEALRRLLPPSEAETPLARAVENAGKRAKFKMERDQALDNLHIQLARRSGFLGLFYAQSNERKAQMEALLSELNRQRDLLINDPIEYEKFIAKVTEALAQEE